MWQCYKMKTTTGMLPDPGVHHNIKQLVDAQIDC